MKRGRKKTWVVQTEHLVSGTECLVSARQDGCIAHGVPIRPTSKSPAPLSPYLILFSALSCSACVCLDFCRPHKHRIFRGFFYVFLPFVKIETGSFMCRLTEKCFSPSLYIYLSIFRGIFRNYIFTHSTPSSLSFSGRLFSGTLGRACYPLVAPPNSITTKHHLFFNI